MQLKEVLKIVQMIDNECQALNKELERRRDSLETAIRRNKSAKRRWRILGVRADAGHDGRLKPVRCRHGPRRAVFSLLPEESTLPKAVASLPGPASYGEIGREQPLVSETSHFHRKEGWRVEKG